MLRNLFEDSYFIDITRKTLPAPTYNIPIQCMCSELMFSSSSRVISDNNLLKKNVLFGGKNKIKFIRNRYVRKNELSSSEMTVGVKKQQSMYITATAACSKIVGERVAANGPLSTNH